MAWRDQIRPASFRGVAFLVATTVRSGGRRTVDHEYPMQDETYVEDLGRKYRTFPIEGHVLGDDYRSQADALLNALEAPGPGQLVHPFYGTRTVLVDTYQVRETLTEEGRIARFSVTFKETLSAPTFPTATADPISAVRAAVDSVLGPIRDFFESRFSTEGLPQFVLDSSASILTDSADSLSSCFGPVITSAADAAAFKQEVNGLIDDAGTLVRDKTALFDRLKATFDSATESGATAYGKLTALLKNYDFETSPAPMQTTSTRQQEATNRLALIEATQQLSLVEAVRQTPEITFDSYDDAITVRDDLLVKIDEQADAATDDELFAALTTLRAKLVLAVPGSTRQLARLQTYTPEVTQPSPVLAYDLYGHLRHEDDLVTRNSVRYPGFVPGGKPLQILTDE